jgi:uncharacterized protein (TIGR02246 family)
LKDEEQIRSLTRIWQAATQAGDFETVLGLTSADVVFLASGRAPMGKSEFAAASRVPPGSVPAQIEITSEIQEIQVSGDLAFMRTKLAVNVTPPGATEPLARAGQTLTVFRRVDGKWLLARDANLLVIVPRTTT